MYTTNVAGISTTLHDLWDALKSHIPIECTYQVEPGGDLLEDTTGALTGAWSAAAVAPVTGTHNALMSALSGAQIEWLSATILDGKRMRGRSFIVPLGGNDYTGSGSIGTTAVTAIKAAADTFQLAEAGGFCIWHRPRKAKAATAYHPAVTARAGGHGMVTSTRVPSKCVVLKSRRD